MEQVMEKNILKVFSNIVDRHSLCPGNRLYNSNAFAGETGEVCNQVKKREMSIMKPEWVTQNEHSLPSTEDFEAGIDDELSDALFYLTRLAHDNGTTIEDLMTLQIIKLKEQSDKYKRTFLK